MLRASIVALAGLIASSFATSAFAEVQKPRAVIELFTSQGCSSCPPADRLALELAKDPGLVVLSMPVDYWDYLGWKDTLASPSCTQRQRNYAAQRGDRQVYTPQMVVNGGDHIVGSDRTRVTGATAQTSLAMDITLDQTPGGYRVGIPARAGKTGTVTLVKINHAKTVAIGRGENSGASVTYANVVRGMSKLGDWNGAAQSFEISSAQLKGDDNDGFVVLVQSGTDAKPGQILAAAKGPGI